MPPNNICKGTNAKSKCIDANQSSDGPLHYANNIRSRAKTNIGIKDMAKNIKNKLIPLGYTLIHIRPNRIISFLSKTLLEKNIRIKNDILISLTK